MNFAQKVFLAAVLAMAAAAPAMADQWWTYRGGPKGPPSLTSPDYAYYGGGYAYYGGPGYAYGGPGYAYGGPYPYGGPGYYGVRADEPLYRCTGPATSDCYNSRALQGSR
jgi:hypothetical protein